MRRVVVTGIGIVSSIGNNCAEVLTSLQESKSGLEFSPENEEYGLRSQVVGSLKINTDELIDKKVRRFMGDGAAYAYVAMKEAIADAGLEESDVSNVRTGLIAGSGGPSTKNQVEAVDTLRDKGIRRVGPFIVPRAMSSTIAALATPFKIKGHGYSISSACATSSHSIGHGAELIQLNKQDIVFAGGGEELHWTLTVLFDAMKALSSKYNDRPQEASRAYDKDRDGFVISGGAGILVLEELEHAKARGAKIYAEIVGYGATSDGYDMVQPSGEGAVRCIKQALEHVEGSIDYINSHGTSTPVGDIVELKSIRQVFGENIPLISSTKSLTGHSLGAVGAQEAIYTLLMMQHNFVAESVNIEELDEEANGFPIVQEVKHDVQVDRALTNSFGFGGTNACLVFEKH